MLNYSVAELRFIFSCTDIHRKETVRMEMSTIVESEMERQQN